MTDCAKIADRKKKARKKMLSDRAMFKKDTYAWDEIIAACDEYADGERFDVLGFLYLLDHPRKGVENAQ